MFDHNLLISILRQYKHPTLTDTSGELFDCMDEVDVDKGGPVVEGTDVVIDEDTDIPVAGVLLMVEGIKSLLAGGSVMLLSFLTDNL